MAKRYYKGNYEGMDERRRQERQDAMMISEDRNAIANLPQQVVMKEYPRQEYDNYDLNDNIKGIDVQMRDDARGGKRKSGQAYPEKF